MKRFFAAMLRALGLGRLAQFLLDAPKTGPSLCEAPPASRVELRPKLFLDIAEAQETWRAR